CFVFFFQAEDGIRDFHVTGVQTCALPICKRLLEYDDVMNAQREVIYTKRRRALFGERMHVEISNMMFDTVESVVADFKDSGDVELLRMELIRLFSVECPFEEEELHEIKANELTEKLYELVWDRYTRRREQIGKQAYPVIKNVFETK